MSGIDPDDQAFLSDESRLWASDAVCILITIDGKYLMQFRDPIRGIFFPGHWGLFGGGIDPGEDEDTALVRELEEELGWTLPPGRAERFSRVDLDLTCSGIGKLKRIIFELKVTQAEADKFVLGEGREMRAFTAAEILTHPRVVPYDRWAIWLHGNRGRIDHVSCKG